MVSMACLCLILAIAAVLLNRAFCIGALSGIIFLLFSFEKVAWSKKAAGFSLLFLLVAIAVVAIFLKSDSSLGRLLIYKISWNMFSEHPVTGIGWGNFQRDYGLYQAAYFSAANYSQKEFLLAGNTYYAFNDYWEFIVETGVIGAVCLFTFLCFIVRLAYHRLHTTPKDGLLKLLLALLLVIGVAALFTHVFEHRPFKIVLVCILAYLGLSNQNFKIVAVLSITVAFTVFQYYFEIKNISSYRKWEQGKILSATGYVLEGREIYIELYPSFKNNISFLKDYNDALSGQDNLGKKIFLLKKILSRNTHNISYLNLAMVYEQLGLKKEAELTYITSVNLVPNRFVPKEAIYNFYIKHKQYKQAAHWRKIILTMPVKIPSERVEAIKQTVKNQNKY